MYGGSGTEKREEDREKGIECGTRGERAREGRERD